MPLEENHFERLEAYIDGTLEAKPRADLERELASNPQLRKVMAELSSVRDWVTALPRAGAPSDLIETFQGQLERSVLLGESGVPESDVVMRIDRYSQFMSVAAILLLATGLGLVLYKVLPDKRPNAVALNARLPMEYGDVATRSPSVADEKLAGPRPTASGADVRFDKSMANGSKDSSVGFGGGGGGLSGEDSKANRLATGGVAAEPLAPKPAVEPLGGVAMSEPAPGRTGDKTAIAASNDRDQIGPEDVRRLQQRIAGATTAMAAMKSLATEDKRDLKADSFNANQDAPVVLLVNAQDPRQANQDVSEFFAKNSIASLPLVDAVNPELPLRQFENGNSYFQLPPTISTKAEANNLPANNGQITNSPITNSQNFNSPATPTLNGGNGLNNYATTNRSGAQFNDANGNSNFDRNVSNQTSLATTVPAGYGRYRAMLTNRQQSELNDYIARRGNQWAERTNDSRGSITATGASEKAKASDSEFSGKMANREVGLKPAVVPTSQSGSVADGLRSEVSLVKKQEANKAPVDSNDELHEVMIVVNDQPVILPTVLQGLPAPGSSLTLPSTTQPIPADKVPATQPALPIDAVRLPATGK